MRRGEAFLKAGADILFIEAPRSHEELVSVAETFKGVPLVANMVEDGKTPYLDGPTLQEIGYKIAIFPVSALLSVAERLQTLYRAMLEANKLPVDMQRVTFQKYNEIIGLPDMLAEAAALEDEGDI
mgnify:FL=1